MNLPLFCFGSLMDRDVLACVVGAEAAASVVSVKGRVVGFRKVGLPHESYPVLVADVLGCASGLLLYGLDQEGLDRVVFFEGEEYQLSPCSVWVDDGDGGERLVEALFFDEGVMPSPLFVDWDFAVWQRVHKDYMLRQSAVYMSYYGRMSAAEADVYWQEYCE